jgi:hypothetical protein
MAQTFNDNFASFNSNLWYRNSFYDGTGDAWWTNDPSLTPSVYQFSSDAGGSFMYLTLFQTPGGVTTSPPGLPYTSGVCDTWNAPNNFEQTFGYWEMTCRVDRCPGLIFGMDSLSILSWPPNITIAIFTDTSNGMHVWMYVSGTDIMVQDPIAGFDITTKHSYGFNWTPSSFQFFIDRVSVGSFVNPGAPYYDGTYSIYSKLHSNTNYYPESGDIVNNGQLPQGGRVYNVSVFDALPFTPGGGGGGGGGSTTPTQWESFSLIYSPPAHIPIQWLSSGKLDSSASIRGNPSAPTKWPLTFEADASSGIFGRPRGAISSGGTISAAASAQSGIPRLIMPFQGNVAGSGSVGGSIVTAFGASGAWQMNGQTDATASVSSRGAIRVQQASRVDAAAGIFGNATTLSHALYQVSGEIDGVASVSGQANLGHQYLVTGSIRPTAGVIPFGGNAPIRVSNFVTNPAAYGIGTGSPGTLPPSWDQFSTDLTFTIVGTGTESQIPYIDVRFNNAASGGGQAVLVFETGLATGPGGVWSYSAFIRQVGGSQTNVPDIHLQLAPVGGGAPLNNYDTTPLTVTTGSLLSNWFHFDGVFVNDAGMDTLYVLMVFNYLAGAVDITLRVGGMRVENLPAASGPQYIVVPKPGFVPPGGSSTNYVY